MTATSRATILDVARLAGVSISTVSRTLNGQTKNNATVEKVQAAASALGYAANASARSMRQSTTSLIAMCVEDVSNPAYLSMVRSAQPLLRDAGKRLMLHSSGGDIEDELELVASMSSHYLDGLILCSLRLTTALRDAIDRAPHPIVLIGNPPKSWRVNSVQIDSVAAARIATQHLVDAGCTNIALVNGPEDTHTGSSRLAGFQEALTEAGLDASRTAECPTWQFDDGLTVAEQLLDDGPVDGIVGGNDRLAVAVLHALRRRGLRVPHDVKVIGMDDGDLARESIPTLSSVSLAAGSRGAMAASLLLRMLRESDFSPQVVSVEPFLTERESTSSTLS